MLTKVWRLLDHFTRMVGEFETPHWIAVGITLIVVGVVCMRGFGSQKSY